MGTPQVVRKHYVLFCHGSEDDKLEGQVSVVSATSTMKAFDTAITNYRKTNRLPKNKHVNCRKLKEFNTAKEADDFYEWFIEEVRKDEKMKRKAGHNEQD